MSSTFPHELPHRSAAADIWVQHKSIIQQLYQGQRKTLKELKEVLERDFGFPNSLLSTYEYRLRQLGIRKNLKKKDWQAIYQIYQGRKGQKSAVYVDGVLVPSTKAWKEMQRSGMVMDRKVHNQKKHLPRGVDVRTPSPGTESPSLPPVEAPLLQRFSYWRRAMNTLDAFSILPDMNLLDGTTSIFRSLTLHTPTLMLRQQLLRKCFRASVPIFTHYVIPNHPPLPTNPVRIEGSNNMFLKHTFNIENFTKVIYMLSNNLEDQMNMSLADLVLDELFPRHLIQFMILLFNNDSPSVSVVLPKVMGYLFRRDRRDDFIVFMNAATSQRPEWILMNKNLYLFYAASFNCPQICLIVSRLGPSRELDYRNGWVFSFWFECGEVLDTSVNDRYAVATFKAIAAGYIDCAEILLHHSVKNFSSSALLSRYRLEALFQYVLYAITNSRAMGKPFQLMGIDHERIINAFIKGGLLVDDIVAAPSQLHFWRTDADWHSQFIASYHVMSKTPEHLRPTLLDVISVNQPTYFECLAHYSSNLTTRLTRWKIFNAAREGRCSLGHYLESLHPVNLQERRLLEITLVEQFIERQCFSFNFDFQVVHGLLSYGLEFDALPAGVSLTMLMARLVYGVNKRGTRNIDFGVFGDIFYQLSTRGAEINAEVVAAAVQHKGTDLLQFLSSLGHHLAKHGCLALSVAARLLNYEAVNWLLSAGVDIHAGAEDNVGVIGKLLLSNMNELRRSEQHQSLQNFFKTPTSVFFPYSFTSTRMLDHLVSQGARLCNDLRESDAHHLLWKLVGSWRYRDCENRAIIRYILEKIEDVHKINHFPCLLEACFEDVDLNRHFMPDSLATFKVLLDGGVLVKSGVLALLIKLQAPMDIIEDILDCGVDPNAYSGNGNPDEATMRLTPVQAAAGACDLAMLKVLMARGGDIEMPALDVPHLHLSQRALAAAVGADLSRTKRSRNEQREVIKFLINEGAQVNAPADANACTPLQTAAQKGDLEIALLLLDHGADINAPSGHKGQKRHAALDEAARWGRLDMVKFLLDSNALSHDQRTSGYNGAMELC
ncbi:hypothetical protein F5Y16DRAFT_415439 [Xylariaceae sp. FL0255]|nr:hypothetical protein F5Y16DRAFT_415439 [Xylariaceae sp. FL0255]